MTVLPFRTFGLRAVLRSLAGLALAVACSSPDYRFVPNPPAAGHCENDLFEPATGETDRDCGGPCRGCDLGMGCGVALDCRQGQCIEGFCQEPGCDNEVLDGKETDIDCGGDCKPCEAGQLCLVPGDCKSSICEDGYCAGATCTDGVKNGNETARDCGGTCDPCPPGSPCLVSSDCTSGVCDEDTMRCVVFCVQGRGECDADLSDECETNLLTSVDHCGSCDNACEFDHAVAACSGGECELASCEPPWDDCNNDPSDGCETDTSASAGDCGACGSECPDTHGKPSCEDSACRIACDKGFEDCNDDTKDGCESTVANDVAHCGGCDTECPEDAGKTAYCLDGECGQTTCDPGFGNCNGDPGDGCEQDLTSDITSCGRCGGLCSVAHGTPACDPDDGCVVSDCDGGWANCNSDNSDGGYDDGCEVNTDDSVDNCGACGNKCSAANGTATCVDGECQVMGCQTGYGDCDGDYDNGCERQISTDKDSCGGCGSAGVQCDTVFQNATGKCVDGACELDKCAQDFDDCTSANGCETNLTNSDQHCGDCSTACQTVGGTNSCVGGTCMLSCDATHASCDMNVPNGCETATTGSSAVTHCGGCSTSCSSAGTTSTTCNGSGTCVPTCNSTHASCDSNPTNGCETATTGAGNEAHCGGCTACSTANASGASCDSQGRCVLTCSSNRLDCNFGSANDGCETTQNASNCGACGQQCLFGTSGSPNRHSTASSCSSGSCSPSCEAGWGACSSPENGCLTQLNADTNCGACGTACSGNTSSCVQGSSTRCQATVTLVNDVDGQVSGNTLTLTHSLQAGANRLILVAVGSVSGGNGVNGARPDSVTYGGTGMTLAAEQAGVNDWWGPSIFFYTLTNSGIGSKTNNQQVVINGASSPSPSSIAANVLELTGVDQSSPLGTKAGGTVGSPDPSEPFTIGNTLNIATPGSRVYSFVVAMWTPTNDCPVNVTTAGCPTWTIAPSGLTANETFAMPQFYGTGTEPLRAYAMFVSSGSASSPGSGNLTITWVPEYAGRITHLAVPIQPAHTP